MKKVINTEKIFTIRDIVKITKWKDVKKAYLYYYGKRGLNGLEEIFGLIKTFRKQRPKDNKEFLEIMVGGTFLNDPEEDRFYSIHTIKENKEGYSLSFRKWRELANIPIQEETIRRYKFNEIICHFLWEITYYGYDEGKINKKAKEIFSIHKEAIKDIKPKKIDKTLLSDCCGALYDENREMCMNCKEHCGFVEG